MKIWISGACGHMGRAVAEAAGAAGIDVLGGIDRTDAPAPCRMYRSFEEVPSGGDAVIDFSSPAALDGLLAWCLREKLPDQPLQYLTYDVTDEIISTLTAHRLDLDTQYTALTEDNIRLLHQKNIKVNAWTVNDPDVALKLASWGIDLITTNILENG